MTTDLPVTGQEVLITPILTTAGRVAMKNLGRVDFVRFEDQEKTSAGWVSMHAINVEVKNNSFLAFQHPILGITMYGLYILLPHCMQYGR